mmetsp:Transcript_35393/g.43707  ORF Transcript_35393/g.43707 Transcript_35393/m.43707 type:complete len:96 (+) Transcript_35393:650-937(+)
MAYAVDVDLGSEREGQHFVRSLVIEKAHQGLHQGQEADFRIDCCSNIGSLVVGWGTGYYEREAGFGWFVVAAVVVAEVLEAAVIPPIKLLDWVNY